MASDRLRNAAPLISALAVLRGGGAAGSLASDSSAYSRPVRCRNTSSRVAPDTRSPARAPRSASPASTTPGSRVAIVSETPSSVTLSGAAPGPARPRAASGGQQPGLHADPQRPVQPPDQGGRRPVLEDHSMIHDRHPVAERLGLVHVVRGQHHGPPLGADLPQQVPQVPPGLRVQRPGRLVEEQHLRVVHQRARDRQPLRLAAGQLFGAGTRLVVEPDDAEHRRPRAAPGRRTAWQRSAAAPAR